MARRSYRQNCALARAADVVGERWTLLLIRDLLVGPRRYSELARSLKGVGSNLLAARLKELEADGLVERRPAKNGPAAYALTAAGDALEPAVLALVRWGFEYGPANRSGDYHQDDWDLVALKALFDRERAAGKRCAVQFDAPGEELWASVDDGEIRIGRGRLDEPDVTVQGTVGELQQLGRSGPAPFPVVGSRRALRSFKTCFSS